MYIISQLLLILLGGCLMILLVVGIHEFGHFLSARLLGVKVERFVIGFGRPLFKLKSSSNIEYIIALIPLGGYVKLLDSREQGVPQALIASSFDHKVIWKRVVIILAGPFFNFLFAIICLWCVWMIGFSSVKPVVKEIIPHSIAALAGIKQNDQIMSIERHQTNDWPAVIFGFIYYLGDKKDVAVTVKADGIIQTKKLPLAQWHFDPLKPHLLISLGIKPLIPKPEDRSLIIHNQASGFAALSQAIHMSWYYIAMNFTVLKKIIYGILTIEVLAGPLTIFLTAATSLKEGLVSYIHFLGIMNIAVGIVNLLPIPGLDGSQLIYLMIEKIRHKPLSIRTQVLVYKLGMIVILLLFIQVMLNDVQRLFLK